MVHGSCYYLEYHYYKDYYKACYGVYEDDYEGYCEVGCTSLGVIALLYMDWLHHVMDFGDSTTRYASVFNVVTDQ